MSLDTAVKGKVIQIVLDKLSASEPRTTLAGAALAAVIATKVDYSKVLQGDPTQLGNLIAAVLVAVIGYFTNHKKLTSPSPSPVKPASETSPVVD
jgi:hypothetical protein